MISGTRNSSRHSSFRLPSFETHIPLLRVPRELPLVLSSDVPVVSSQQFAYLVRVIIGGQDFWLTFDTGSSDLWVVSSECTNSDCLPIKKYSEATSKTLSLSNQPFKLQYLLGSVQGTVGTEVVTVGPYQISSQTFAVASQTDGLGLADTGNSGILGLSFPLAASISPTSGTTVLENLFSHFDDSHRYFAYKLGRNETHDASKADSSFTIGALDPNILNDTSQLAFTPVFSAAGNAYDYWKLPIQAITIDSLSLPLSNSLVPGSQTPIAVLDTGTTLILGPTIDVNNFWAAVGTGGSARYNQQSRLWEVRCERAVDVRFKLGNKDGAKEYALHPEDISWAEELRTDGWCTGGIQANDGVNSGDWLLGDVFLRNVYVVHQGATATNPPMIGLLNITNPSSSMSQFQEARGLDSAPPPLVQTHSRSTGPSRGDLIAACTACGAGGFIVGLVGMMILRLRGRSRKHKIRL
ncbi:aspartic peptidase domain-containing protein [Hygrophoropsis aurantiaca]|uniref:Aspartic peptidase domain-containing protein n=1 Tax=Hygrophoropsis aurantiaca TaxID=72124 RepID=A0ACB8A9G6_9AGAM|nr:aspartic peptidase domain-containing protein [Hygrophoropsis aurantiaca]